MVPALKSTFAFPKVPEGTGRMNIEPATAQPAAASLAEGKPESAGSKLTRRYWGLVLGSVGVVYGDIGTSPIYAFRESLTHAGRHAPQRLEVFGVVSLILWSLILIVTIKYVLFLMRADNRGEGGTLSLLALIEAKLGKRTQLLFFLGIAGAALFYGDAVITPAISVLSAVEGLQEVTHVFDPFIVHITLVVLIGLFLAQSNGTSAVAALFGPVMVVWFFAIGAIGFLNIQHDPWILQSVSPVYGVQFLVHHGRLGFLVLGSVFLAITGAEALYADMGHFGRGANPRGVARAGSAGSRALLSWAGRGRSRAAGYFARSVLLVLSECAPVADGYSGDSRDRYREPGRHHRSLLAHPAGHSTRPSTAARNSTHVSHATWGRSSSRA